MGNTTTEAQRKERLRKLFNKANDGAVTEPERDALLAKVAELITIWDMADVDLTDAVQPVQEIAAHEYPVCAGRAGYGVACMGEGLAQLFGGCTMFRRTYWSARHEERWPGVRRTHQDGTQPANFIVITFWGTQRNADRWRMWMDFLTPQMLAAIAASKPSSIKTFATAFSSHVTFRARSVFKHERNKPEAEEAGVGESYALALRDARAVMEERNPRLGASEKFSYTDGMSAVLGGAAGKAASLPATSIQGGAAGALRA